MECYDVFESGFEIGYIEFVNPSTVITDMHKEFGYRGPFKEHSKKLSGKQQSFGNDYTCYSLDYYNVLFTLNRTTHSSKTLLCVVKFMFSKKATKIDEIFTINLT